MLITIIAFIIIFGILVLVHEFGHFYVAKKNHILVREFSIGMGPKIWWHRSSGTTYTLRLLPVGGYVRLAGADDEDEDEDALRPGTSVTVETNDSGKVNRINTSEKHQLFTGIPLQLTDHDLVDGLWLKGYVNGNEDEVKLFEVDHDAILIEPDGTAVQIAPRDVQFQSASLPARMAVNFAGPFNNFLLSLAVFFILGFTLGGIPNNSNRLGQVIHHSVAANAGLQSGDRIVAISGHRTKNWNALATAISSKPGKQLTVTYQRHGQTRHTTMTPRSVKQGTQHVGQVGIEEELNHSTQARVRYGWQRFTQSGTLIFAVLGHMVTHGFDLNDLGGPVAIYAGTSAATAQGFNGVLNFLALLSINLGIVNLLPVPALDGGKLLFNIIEGIIRRPIPEQVEAVVNLAGFAFLMLLMILVTWNDIQRYFIH